MKDILNLKIKRRESFRPFAPSILREHVAEWFEDDDDVPFMMQVYPIREAKRALIPAVHEAFNRAERRKTTLLWEIKERILSAMGTTTTITTTIPSENLETRIE